MKSKAALLQIDTEPQGEATTVLTWPLFVDMPTPVIYRRQTRTSDQRAAPFMTA
ncbi:MAG: hypothetical protein JO153_09640 [Solirubrobacterales bacterium]|nr:hypothetical protein [Solirubrobacterales bacterium]